MVWEAGGMRSLLPEDDNREAPTRYSLGKKGALQLSCVGRQKGSTVTTDGPEKLRKPMELPDPF